jgi:crotonobetainyl-CoA:carnitine CoA-transferase CaiB-like acyl-CoA transferase
VKVEAPTKGDYMRATPPYLNGKSLMHQVIDRGKKSIAIDLGDAAELDIFRRLTSKADVIIDGNRPGSLARYGINYAETRAAYPKLIVCSVTGFGQDGPLAGLPAHGFTVDTLAGVSPIIENADGTVTLGWELSSTIGIECGALSAVVAVLGSILTVRAGGNGSWIDVSLWDAALQANRFSMAWALSDQKGPLRMHDQGPLYGAYKCQDGRKIWFAALEQKFWQKFCTLVERPDLVDRWDGNGDIGFGTEDLRAVLQGVFLTRTAEDWADLFGQNDIPGNRILSPEEVTVSPHFKARAIMDAAENERAIRTVGAAPVFTEHGHRLGHGLAPAPALGADTEDVIATWTEAATV